MLQVGINAYPSSPLNGCVNDVRQMDEVLAAHKWQPAARRVLLDGQATRAAIRAGMAWLLQQDVQCLIFQYSGHGTILRDQSGDEPSGIDGAICPVDYTRNGFILDDEFGAMTDKLKRGQRLIFFFDSCYSGAAQRLAFNFESVNKLLRRSKPRFVRADDAVIPGDKYYDPINNRSFNNERSIMVATAQPNVLADDAWIAGQYRGAGTYALMTSWLKQGPRVSYQAIISTANYWLRTNGHNQRVVYGGRDFHFFRPFLT